MSESAHAVAVTIDDGGDITWEVSCSALPGAFCRVACHEGCEEWSMTGHVHPLADAGRCLAVECLDAFGVDECYEGGRAPLRSGPIDVRWEGESYSWVYAPEADAALATPLVSVPVDGSTSDGFHTFAELYESRLLLHAWAVRAWLAAGVPVVKSWRHGDGEECFGGGWFIVSAELPSGQVSFHYPAAEWGLFDVPVVDRAPEWDGHSTADVHERLRAALADPGLVAETRVKWGARRMGFTLIWPNVDRETALASAASDDTADDAEVVSRLITVSPWRVIEVEEEIDV